MVQIKRKSLLLLRKILPLISVTANNKVTAGSGANKITLDGTDGSVTGKSYYRYYFHRHIIYRYIAFTARATTVINTKWFNEWQQSAITGTGA